MPTATLTLLPARRAGSLLRDQRHRRGWSIDDVADRAALTPEDVGLLEAGGLLLPERQLDDVLRAYGTTIAELTPPRSQVVVDLDKGEVVVADESAFLGADAPTADELLAAYLSLLYTLRNAAPGTDLVLRRHDVTVLSRVLHLTDADVEGRLIELMGHPSEDLGRYHAGLRRRWAVPVAAALVVAGAVGTILLVRDGGDAPPTSTTTTRPGAVESPFDPDVSLVPPAVSER